MRNFLTIEMLHTLPYSCANRDMSNAPKTADYPGGLRGRISSQSFKREQRLSMKAELNNFEFSDRSRSLPKFLIDDMITYVTATGETPFANMPREERRALVGDFFNNHLKLTIGKDSELKKFDEYVAEAWDEKTQVLLHFNRVHALLVLGHHVYIYKTDKKNVEKSNVILREILRNQDLVDIALYGIMLASGDLNSRTDGALSVAQSVTVHPVQLEIDFWTAMGDFASETHQGSENMGTSIFSHGVFYSSQTIDLRQLKKNLPDFGEDEIVEAVKMVIRNFASYKPAAKKTNSAPFAEPALVLATISDKQVNHSAEFYSHPVEFVENIEEIASERLINRAVKDARRFDNNSREFIALAGYDFNENDTVNFVDSISELQDAIAAYLLSE